MKPDRIPTMTDEEMSSHKVQEKIPDSVDDDDDLYEKLKGDVHWYLL